MRIGSTLMLILMFGVLGARFAQDSLASPQVVTPIDPSPALPQNKVPDGDGAWALDLVTSGGFDGMGIGTFSVDSGGTLTCSLTRNTCPDKLAAAPLSSLGDKVKAAAAVPWGVRPTQNTFCSDCIANRLQLRMRLPDLSIRVLVTSWDAISGAVPEPVLNLYKTLTAFGRH